MLYNRLLCLKICSDATGELDQGRFFSSDSKFLTPTAPISKKVAAPLREPSRAQKILAMLQVALRTEQPRAAKRAK